MTLDIGFYAVLASRYCNAITYTQGLEPSLTVLETVVLPLTLSVHHISMTSSNMLALLTLSQNLNESWLPSHYFIIGQVLCVRLSLIYYGNNRNRTCVSTRHYLNAVTTTVLCFLVSYKKCGLTMMFIGDTKYPLLTQHIFAKSSMHSEWWVQRTQ